MLDKELYLNLQLFGEGDGGESSEGSEASGEEIPAFIPEKAKSVYKKAMERTKANVPAEQSMSQSADEATEAQKPSHVPFADLIKSDEYKEEHKAYMDKTIKDRFKKYDGIEKNNSDMKELLDMVAQKYGVDSSSESFLEDMRQKIEDDDSYYEQYAMENDISTQEARKIVNLERKVKKAEAEEAQRRNEAVMREANMRLLQNAEATKQRFPGFDLETELQNPKFVQLCQSTNEDVMAAYMACHWGEIIPNTVQMATQKAQIQTANAIKSGASRPIENGLSSQATAVTTTDYSRMNLQQLREQADRWRRGLD